MIHPLEQRLARVRRRVRCLLAAHALSWALTAVAGALIVVGLADYLFRFQDPGIRLLCSLAVLGAFAWSVRHFLARTFGAAWRDVDLARRLGREFPDLGDALPSAVEFLHQREDDLAGGSASLRRTVVAQTTAAVEKVDFMDAVRAAPTARAAGLSAAVLSAAAALLIGAPQSSAIALARLANPFGRTAWPQATHLAILQRGAAPAMQLVRGETFDVRVFDLSGDPLPENLRIHYRFEPARGAAVDEVRVTRPLEDARTTRRVNVENTFAFRFEVDGQPWSQWCEVRVVPGESGSVAAAAGGVSSPVLVARVLPVENAESAERPNLAVLLPQRRIERVVRGDAFEVDLVDAHGAHLPSRATAFFRFKDDQGRTQAETAPVQHLGRRIRLRRENLTRSLEYRVEAGDDLRMPWIPVEVLEAPRIERHRARIEPPGYSGLPPGRAETLVRGLVGSRVKITAEANRPLASAACCSEKARQPCRVAGPEQRTIEVDFALEESSVYWFELVDQNGLAGVDATRWDVYAVPDAAPAVAIERPAANVFVTPQATVPLRASVKDDLAVRRIDLVYVHGGGESGAARRLPLYHRAGPDGGQAASGAVQQAGEIRSIEHDWRLGSLGLRPGSQIAFHIEAADDLPQTGQSETRRIHIITPEELAERIASRQSLILAELARVLEMQRQCRRQVAELEIRLEENARFDRPEVDQLRGAELNQREVHRSLTSRGEGVPMHVVGVLADLDNNGVDNADVRSRMEDILARLGQLDRQHLPAVTLHLTAAIKAAQIELEQQPGTGGPERAAENAGPPLGAAGKEQETVIAALEELLGELAQWENYRQFHRQLAQVLREQKDLIGQTAALARKTLGRNLRDLATQEAAELKIQARRQAELARQFSRIEDEMRRSAAQLEESEPAVAETMAQALAEARRRSLSAAIHAASEDLGANRTAQARNRQKEVVEGLEQLLDILSNRRESELDRWVRRLRRAEEQLGDLERREADVARQMAAAQNAQEEERRGQLQRIGALQQEVREEAERAAAELAQLAAQQAGEKTQAAAEKMGQSNQSAQKGDAQQAAGLAEEARQRLQEARDQLAQQRRQAEAELAFEQLARLEDGLRAVRQRQQSALEATARLDGLQREQGRLTEAQAATLRSLAEEQRLLCDETLQVRDQLASAAVFALVLTETAKDMSSARTLLEQGVLGAPVQQAESSALARLDQLLAALQPEPPGQEDSPSDQGGSQGEEKTPPPAAPGDALKAMAELKLLKLMQMAINERTRAMEEQYGSAEKMAEAAKAEYTRLGEQQGQLADLLLGLMQQAADPEDEPDRLPAPRPDGG
ncbi:MAG: hypothetical protein GXY25_02245 [Pirellulaceae bacterium]|jgi:hypothetical protein|nr:hypothetical protein [Thermoguttaceae bacterium]NLY99338.1 hypothetical protein [Pirellulaceae bacterium]